MNKIFTEPYTYHCGSDRDFPYSIIDGDGETVAVFSYENQAKFFLLSK